MIYDLLQLNRWVYLNNLYQNFVPVLTILLWFDPKQIYVGLPDLICDEDIVASYFSDLELLVEDKLESKFYADILLCEL